MSRTDRIELIRQIAKKPDAFEILEQTLAPITHQELGEELLTCGIIPERFAHDSSEEKLWAKYCDILLSHTLNALGIHAQVIRARGDSADVLGNVPGYTIVGDAKAFRLSRTAKNQKDFKVAALDDWRRSNTFACLVAPLYQFPTRTSQIYYQAESKNVTLLSYVHLKFLLDHSPQDALIGLWQLPGSIEPSKDGRIYWGAVDDLIVVLTNASYEQLRLYKKLETERTTEIGHEGIQYWQSVIASYHDLSKEEAVKRLIKAEKIDQKIDVINRVINKADGYAND